MLGSSVPLTLPQKATKYVQTWKFGLMLTYGLYTYDDSVANHPAGDPNLWNPGSTINIDQWLDAAVSCGMQYAILTAKHQDGCCNWPTATTTHSIASSSWYSGPNGFDLVGRFVQRCRARGIQPGLYHSIYDKRFELDNPGFTQAAYKSYLQAQLTELLTNYGPLECIWSDGGHWHFGSYYPWTNAGDMKAFCQAIQSDCLYISNDHVNTLTSSDVIEYEVTGNGTVPINNTSLAEQCDTIYTSGFWGWDRTTATNNVCKSASTLNANIATALSHNACYMLGVPPNTSGLLPDDCVTVLASLHT